METAKASVLTPKSGSSSRLFHVYLPLALTIFLALSYFAYVHAYGVNVLFWDEWQIVPLYKACVEGHAGLFSLFEAQHNGNIMFFPYLLMLAMDFLTGFNNKALMYIGAVFQTASLGLVWFLARKNLPDTINKYWHLVSLACLMFSFCQYQNMLWGFQTAWFIITFFSLAAFVLLDESFENDKFGGSANLPLTFGAIVCGVVASFSSVQGLLVWPAGLVFLFAKEWSSLKYFWKNPRFTAWIVSGFLCWVVYFSLLNPADAGPQSVHQAVLGALKHPLYTFKFMLASLGAVVIGIRPHWAVLLGIVLYALIGLAIINFFRSKNTSAYAVPAALIVFGLFFDIMLAAGRSSFGFSQAFESHYTAYNLLILLGIYLCFVNQNYIETHSAIVAKSGQILLGVFLLAFTFSNVFRGVARGREWRFAQALNAVEVLHYQSEPRFKIERTVFGSYDFVAAQAEFLNSRYLNVFQAGGISLPLEILDLARPPESYLDIEKANPGDKEALERLWDVYTIAPDLQKAFRVRTASFSYDLIRWASGEAKEKGYYLQDQLNPYGKQFVLLFNQINSKKLD